MIRPTSSIGATHAFSVMPSFRRAAGIGRLDGALQLRQARALTDLSRRLDDAKATLERLRSSETVAAALRLGRRDAARAATQLALGTPETAAELTSSAEINPASTSFSPFGPVVNGLTTAEPTIGGVYSGAQGDDTLTFEFRQDATVGSGSRLDVWVYDGSGSRIDTLRFRDVAPDEPIALSNGLTLALGAGLARRNDTFTVDVFASVGSQVDPTKPFDGIRNEQPNFEIGLGVSAGAFEVNGEVIDVAADDSIDSVLAKINASNAGVSASYDSASDRIRLVHDVIGPTGTIVLANDTSNFLNATKLAGASLVPGNDGTRANDPLAQVPELAAIQSGGFSINGVTFTVDPQTDTLEDLVARINASAAGAEAFLDVDSSLLSIRARSDRDELDLADGTSGFFTALGIAPILRRPVVRPGVRQSGFAALPAVQNDLVQLGKLLDGLFDGSSASPAEWGAVRDRLRESVEASFEASLGVTKRSVLRSGFGLDFDFTRPRGVVEIDRDRFEKASIESFEALHAFLFLESADGESKGLLPALFEALADEAASVKGRLALLDPRGRLVDFRA